MNGCLECEREVVIGLKEEQISVAEYEGQVQVCVVISSEIARPLVLSFNITTQDESATGGLDYTSEVFTSTEEFAAFSQARELCFPIPILEDGLFEDSETFSVRLAVDSLQSELLSVTNAVTQVIIQDSRYSFTIELTPLNVNEPQFTQPLTLVCFMCTSETETSVSWSIEGRPIGHRMVPSNGTLLIPILSQEFSSNVPTVISCMVQENYSVEIFLGGCALDHQPVVGNEGELETCLPCSVGSTRMSPNATECTQSKLQQYFPVGENFQCQVCPPGTEELNQNYTSCVCNLLYWPLIQNNNLVGCIRCPDGSSRISQDDLNCTCDLLYYPVMQNNKLLECRLCPFGRTRMSQNDTECTQCILQYFPVEDHFRCQVCPPGSERPNQKYTSCVCKPLYQPVIQNNNLVSCIPCPPGSSRLSQDDLNCTCDLRFYPVGLSEAQSNYPAGSNVSALQNDALLECRPCPVGSTRLKHSTNECTCQLQLYPDLSSDGKLQECHPCPINSARLNTADLMCTCSGNTVTTNGNRNTTTEEEICNTCPLEYTVVANSTAGLYLCEPCRPPGSKRLSHADKNCVCGLEYYPVVQNGTLQACNRCTPGSSRLTFSDTECTCNDDYYDSRVSNSLTEVFRCHRCPAGSSRNRNAIKCKCQPGLLSSGDDNISLRCSPCPMNSEKKTADDGVCTCLDNTMTMNGNTTTTSDACFPPMPAPTPIIVSSQPPMPPQPTNAHAQGLVVTIIAVTIPCVVVTIFIISIACGLKHKRNNKPKAFMEEVDLNFHPVDVSRGLSVSTSTATELCNLSFEEKHCDICASDVKEQVQEIISEKSLDSEMRLGSRIIVNHGDTREHYGKRMRSVNDNSNEPAKIGCLESNNQAYNEIQHYEHAGGVNYDPTQRYELAGSAYNQTQSYKLAGSSYDQTQRYELAGSAYDQTQRYELACSTYDQTQRYELAGSAYDQTQRYELAGSAYDHIQSYEQLGSDYNQTQGHEQPSVSTSDHACIDSDATESFTTSTSPKNGYGIDANRGEKVENKKQTESDAGTYTDLETTNSHSHSHSHSHKEDGDVCKQVQSYEQAISGDASDQVQSYEQIVNSYGQAQSYQQAYSTSDVIQDYSQVLNREQTSN